MRGLSYVMIWTRKGIHTDHPPTINDLAGLITRFLNVRYYWRN